MGSLFELRKDGCQSSDKSLFLYVFVALMASCFFVSCDFIDRMLPEDRFIWSGQTWKVRQSPVPDGPLDNYFDDSSESVRVDGDGALHLGIRESGGIWYASEIYSVRSFGYGTYDWTVQSPLDDMDPSFVLGLFTYGQSRAYSHREIDIEFSAWDNPEYLDRGQFAVQPYHDAGHMLTFPLSMAAGSTRHRMTWSPGRIDFASWTGTNDKPASPADGLLSEWSFTESDSVPVPGDEKVHMNFYLMGGGNAPSRGMNAEIVLSGFSFTELPRESVELL